MIALGSALGSYVNFTLLARGLRVGDARAFDSIEAMVEDPAIDCIWICGPNFARVENMERIVAAIKKGARLRGIAGAPSSISSGYVGDAVYNASYDIWLDPTPRRDGVNAMEIMIWFNKQGSIQPIGSAVGNTTIGGRTWQVWQGSNGSNNVISYVAPAPNAMISAPSGPPVAVSASSPARAASRREAPPPEPDQADIRRGTSVR